MDVASYLQRFEHEMSSFGGDDPLEQWDKFVELLLRKFPPDNTSQLSFVFNRLVETFLNVEKYANDERYISYCIKYASSYATDPIALYSHIFSKGVGTHSPALYVSWAQQLERRSMNDQAEAVFQQGLAQALPSTSVLHEYRQFQLRTKHLIAPSAGARNPLQNSNSGNIMTTRGEPSVQNKESVDCQPAKPAERKYVTMVSRSEYSGKLPPSSNENCVSAYDKEALQCEGSELCFEEVRAQRYFQKIQEQHRQQEEMDVNETIFNDDVTQFELNILMDMNRILEIGNPKLSAAQHQRPSVYPSNRMTLGLRPQSESTLTNNAPFCPEPEHFLDSEASVSTRSLHVSPTVVSKDTLGLYPGISYNVPLVNQSTPALAPAASMSFHAPAPAASMSFHAPAPAASMSFHAPAPAASMSYQAPVPPEFISHKAPVPAASMSHHESILLQGLATDNCPAENVLKENEDPLEPEQEANVSQGGAANLSRVTPNNSLSYIQATPSRVLPSPTVNTREALDVIMDMFQASTVLEDPFPNMIEKRDYDVIYTRNGPSVKPAAAAPFTIFQDEEDAENKENGSAPFPPRDKVNSTRALCELPKSTKPNDTPSELTPDESTMWDAQFQAQSSLAACPNSTSDFALMARFVSTPFTLKTPMSTANFFPEQENGEGVDEEGFARRCTKKLSPIIEQSPSEEKANNTMVTCEARGSQQGTIVGEALATSCTTMVQPPPPAVLSFRDQTLGPNNNTTIQRSTGPGWEVYTSPQPSPKREPFTIMEDMEEPQPLPQPKPPQDIPMSPESAPRPNWLTIKSPEKSAERDLDVFCSPRRPEAPHLSHLSQDVPMSPQVDLSTDSHMMSPDKDTRAPLDVSMNPKTPRRSRAGPVMSLVPDPWNDDLIAHFLARTDPPLMAHPRCITWQCNLPNIAPKMTLSMGSSSLRVDSVLGEGAFAKVYQATDPMTSDKMVLKVQKPANPWEFYINTQLDARVPPSMRHFYSSFRSVYLFNNGSVLLGDMHNYGTLLNAVNMYRTLGDKVMPQPLVMYFTVCILHMIEQLHSVGIVHADVKPDNFLLGERFLGNTGFDMESLDHGLVLIDMGQSIDMTLFPEGTAFTSKCLTSGFQCTEMQSGKPWNYQTDYFGVAGTVYCMLFGTYMQVVNDGGVWRTNGVFRRNPHSDLWQEFFHTLLNVPDCSSLPDLRGLRHKLLSVLEQTYRTKLPALKSRLVVLLLESSRTASRR